MSTLRRTFSESWHRVAHLHMSIRPTVDVRKQYFRGELWYILQDPFNNQFFRLRPEGYAFVSRLQPDRSVEEVWEECLTLFPDTAPGQEDVIQILAQLYFSNLLYFSSQVDTEQLFERYQKRKQREVRSRLMSIMFMRIPLLDPDAAIKRLMPLFKLILNPLMGVGWLVVVFWAVKVAMDNATGLTDQAQSILAPHNLPLLYLALVIIKTFHEFGHAILCKRLGGEVHTMGIMLLVFTPLPYMDATSSWSFRSRWARALVGGAGILTEVFIAAIATFAWAWSSPGTFHNLCYNVMFIASVSTVLFNANPLLRFDGYYILSDLLDIPNLHSRSREHLRHLCEYYLFGYQDSTSPTRSTKEAAWMTFFGLASGAYRILVFTGIILFIADKFLIAGLIMAVICILSWGVVPIYRFINYLISSPRLMHIRGRAILVSSLWAIVLGTCLFLIPFPYGFKAPGVLEATSYSLVTTKVPGTLETLLVPSGTYVSSGSPLIQFSNPEIAHNIQRAEAQIRELLALQTMARKQSTADLKPIRKRLQSIKAQQDFLHKQQAKLRLTAEQAGLWVAPDVDDLAGSWVSRGQTVGHLINNTGYRFAAVVAQSGSAHLFQGDISKAEVKLYGQSAETIPVSNLQIIPYEHFKLPSAILGWSGGGEIATQMDDQSGRQAVEPFFQVYAFLNIDSAITFAHGRSGKIRFFLPPKPLALQMYRKLRQLFQKRYQV